MICTRLTTAGRWALMPAAPLAQGIALYLLFTDLAVRAVVVTVAVTGLVVTGTLLIGALVAGVVGMAIPLAVVYDQLVRAAGRIEELESDLADAYTDPVTRLRPAARHRDQRRPEAPTGTVGGCDADRAGQQ